MNVWISNKRWKLCFCKVPKSIHGDCNYETSTIRVSNKLTGVDKMDVIIHELIHARWPDISEESCSEFASELSAILTRSGFRDEWDHE